MMRWSTQRAVLLVLAWLIAGCSQEGSAEIQAWVDGQKSLVQPSVPALPTPWVFSPQMYAGAGVLDPFDHWKLIRVFKPDAAARGAQDVLLAAEKNRQKEALEHYPLSSLVMVGTLQRAGRNTALLRVNQEVYLVGVGSYIGPHYGQIVAIGETQLQFREIVQDIDGVWSVRMGKLDLYEGGQ